jgi:DNA-binding HxlR family transcriptional regulator
MSDYAAQFCPRYHHAIELIGRRWTGVILRVLLHGATRFSDVANAVPDLSDKMLAERLRELEAEGIVTRTVIPEAPVRVEYRLTDKGRALEGAVAALTSWAEAWLPAGAAAAESDCPAAVSGAGTRAARGRLA